MLLWLFIILDFSLSLFELGVGLGRLLMYGIDGLFNFLAAGILFGLGLIALKLDE